jgi:hypothetical protein
MSVISSRSESSSLMLIRECGGEESLSLSLSLAEGIGSGLFLESLSTFSCIVEVWTESAEDFPVSKFWSSDSVGGLEMGSTSDFAAT